MDSLQHVMSYLTIYEYFSSSRVSRGYYIAQLGHHNYYKQLMVRHSLLLMQTEERFSKYIPGEWQSHIDACGAPTRENALSAIKVLSSTVRRCIRNILLKRFKMLNFMRSSVASQFCLLNYSNSVWSGESTLDELFDFLSSVQIFTHFKYTVNTKKRMRRVTDILLSHRHVKKRAGKHRLASRKNRRPLKRQK